jgi:uncharacterized cupredoxin-like copper-binding protein
MKVSGSRSVRSSRPTSGLATSRNTLGGRQRHLTIESLEQRTLLAVTLPVPGEVTGDLESGDFDVYELTPGAGEHLVVQLDNADDRDNNEIYIRHGAVPDWTDPAKYDAEGTVPGYADQFVEIPQTQTGTYFVLVRCTYDSTGGSDDYALRADTLATLPSLGIGVQTDDMLGEDDFDIYQVAPGAGEHLVVQLDNADDRDNNEIYIRHGAVPDWTDPAKYDADGTVPGYADQFVEIPQTQAGTYFVLVRCTYDSTGGSDDYALRADTLTTLPSLGIGVETDDMLGEDDFDIYQLAPGADEHLVVQLDNADDRDNNEIYIRHGAVPDWTDPAKYDADGTVPGYADQFVDIPQTQAGTYFVLVRCTYDSTGGSDDYDLRADTLATLPSLGIGVETDDMLGEDDFDIYQLAPGAGEHLVVQLDNVDDRDNNEIYIRHGGVPDWTDPAKYDADGTVPGYADQFVDIPQTQAGTYFVLVRCTYDSTGGSDDYDLRADTLATLPSLGIGVETDDMLGEDDFDIYQVAPGAGEHLVVQLDNADDRDNNEIYIRHGAVPDWTDPAKYDADGTVPGYADQFVEIPQTQAGTYFVLVRCTYDSTGGFDDYGLRADTTVTLPSLYLGVDRTGELGEDDFDIYRLYLGADQHLTVQLDGADDSDDNEVYIRRGAVPDWTDPANFDAVGKVPGESDQFLEITDTEEGMYYVLVRCTYDSTGGSDGYSLRADTTPPWPGFGAVGDSLTDEYWGGAASTWLELLAAEKDMNFGPQTDWGSPRNEGYEYNWARSGATSTTMLSEGQHTGLAEQLDAGAVSCAVLAIGQNDFAPLTGAYQNISSGFWSQAQIDAFTDGVYDNIETALTTLTAAGGSLVMTNVIDYGLAPITQLLVPSATSRARVTTVLEDLNHRLEDLASQYSVPLVDMFQLAHDFLGTGTSTAAEQIGGVTIQLSTGLDPHNAFFDGIHPHTILQGAMGNVFLEAFSLGHELDVDSLEFTEHELLTAAGIGNEYVNDTLTLTYSDYVILPTSIEPIDLGTVDYSHLAGLDPSQGDIWYQLATTRAGELTAIASAASGDVVAELYLPQMGTPLVSSQAVGGEQRLDFTVEAGATYLVKLAGNSTDVEVTLANLVNIDGSAAQVFGTDGVDTFEFALTGSYGITIKGVEYHLDDTSGVAETVSFDGGLGQDSAEFFGGAGDESARFFTGSGEFYSGSEDYDAAGFKVDVTAEDLIAHSGGGRDFVKMYDSPGDDLFTASPREATLVGPGYSHAGHGFYVGLGYATNRAGDDRAGGNDKAVMQDSAESDKFKLDWADAEQFFGKLYASSYYTRAKNFESIDAAASAGSDLAVVLSSPIDDEFFLQKDLGRFSNARTNVEYTHFHTVIAYAGDGNDVAHLEDSDGDDTARARPHKVMLWSGEYETPEYMLTARRFDEYHLEGKHGGFDRAKLHDTALNDHFHGSGNSASLYQNDDELKLLYEVTAFEWIRLYATDTGRQDTIEKEDPLNFELVYDEAMWEEVP